MASADANVSLSIDIKLEITDAEVAEIGLPRAATFAFAIASRAFAGASAYLKTAGLALRNIAASRQQAVEVYRPQVMAALKLGLTASELTSLDELPPKREDESPQIADLRIVRAAVQQRLRHCWGAILTYAFPAPKPKKKRQATAAEVSAAKDRLSAAFGDGPAAPAAGGAGAGPADDEADGASAGYSTGAQSEDDDGASSVNSAASDASLGTRLAMHAGKKRRLSTHTGELGAVATAVHLDGTDESYVTAHDNIAQAGPRFVLEEHAAVIKQLYQAADASYNEVDDAVRAAIAAEEAYVELPVEAARNAKTIMEVLVTEFDEKGNLLVQTTTKPWLRQATGAGLVVAPTVSFEDGERAMTDAAYE